MENGNKTKTKINKVQNIFIARYCELTLKKP